MADTDINTEDILKRSKERKKEFDELLNSPQAGDSASETLDSSIEFGIHKFVTKMDGVKKKSPPPPPPKPTFLAAAGEQNDASDNKDICNPTSVGTENIVVPQISTRPGSVLSLRNRFESYATNAARQTPPPSKLAHRPPQRKLSTAPVKPSPDASHRPITPEIESHATQNATRQMSPPLKPTYSKPRAPTPKKAPLDENHSPVAPSLESDLTDAAARQTPSSLLFSHPQPCKFPTMAVLQENYRPVTPNSEILSSLLDDINHDFEKIRRTEGGSDATNASDGGDNHQHHDAELQHTLSFYRRQTQSRCSQDSTTLSRRHTVETIIQHSPNSSNASSELPTNDATLKRLHEALIVQQDQISQASRALAFCRQHEHFRGSSEEVDAQRALLVATERRRAYLSERDRVISARQSSSEPDVSELRGTLCFSYVAVRLSRDFINMYIQQHSESRVYYFIVLIKYREHVFHTSLASSNSSSMKSGYVEFPNYIRISGLTNDFVITLEVYGLRGSSTARPQEKKRKTIRKMVATPFTEPAAAGAASLTAGRGRPVGVLESGFQKLGHLTLNRSHLNRDRLLLSEVLYPLDGVVVLNMQCFSEQAAPDFRGFLSLYQIVSGLGSWTRFWCVLGNSEMRFWRYPEDEERKPPSVVLELSKCLCDASEVSNSMASFPHSMQVDVAAVAYEGAPAEEIRMLFAADTAEELESWMEAMNKAIRHANIWNSKSTPANGPTHSGRPILT